jgi:Rrf2 family protein
MLDIASHGGAEGPVLLKDVAARQGLSERYLEQIFLSLRHAGLVRSMRGAKGGFMLARSPSRINLLEVVQACMGRLTLVDCAVDPASCRRADKCATYLVWKELSLAMQEFLEKRTLSDLVKMQEKLQGEDSYAFGI